MLNALAHRLRRWLKRPASAVTEDAQRVAWLLRQTGEGLLEMQPQQQRAWISPRLNEMLGRPGKAEACPLSHWEQHLHPDDRPAFRQWGLPHNAQTALHCRLRHQAGYHLRAILRREVAAPTAQAKISALVQDVSEQWINDQTRQMQRAVGQALAQGQGSQTLLPLLLDHLMICDGVAAATLLEPDGAGAYRRLLSRGESALTDTLAPNLSFAQWLASTLPVPVLQGAGAADAEPPPPRPFSHPAGDRLLWVQPLFAQHQAVAVLVLESGPQEALSPTTLRHVSCLASQFGPALAYCRTQEAVSDQEENLRGLFNTVRDFVFVFSHEGQVLYVNQVVVDRLGYERDQLIGHSFLHLRPPEDRNAARQIMAQVLDRRLDSCHLPLVAADGHQVPAETHFIHGQWNRQPALFAVCRDISERLATDTRLRLAASVFENAREGILITDPNGCIIDVNQSFTRLSGYERLEAIGQSPRLMRSGQHDQAFYAELWHQLKTQRYWQGEIWNRRKSGELYAEQLNIAAVRDESDQVTHYVATFTDITPLKEHERRLDWLAHFDPLTQLPNRALLADRLEQAMASSRRSGKLLAVCFLDLDGFKPINDQYGHAAGDELLKEVASRLRDGLRESDTVARLGGDEFTLLLTELAQAEEIHPAIQRLLQRLTPPFDLPFAQVSISASVGIALYPQDDVPADRLLRHADRAMYAAKQAGRACYRLFCAETMGSSAKTLPLVRT